MLDTHPMSLWETRARQVCNNTGVSITQKRLEVFAALLKVDRPLSAYELITTLKDCFGRHLTPISIYRMLNFLEEKHLVRKLKSTGKYVAFSVNQTVENRAISQFLICHECGSVKEVGIEDHALQELKAQLDSSGFQFKNLELEWDCVCNHCMEKQKNQS